MKISKGLFPTLRDAPSDAEVISHKLLVRAGMIRKVTSGIYEFLPLGYKALRKVEEIIRDELTKAGCQEVNLPHMVPSELWQQSGRWEKYGKELLRIKDRGDREYCFGPTHEEVICDLVSHTVSSYKALPLNLFQIQTKFRDEIRPRFGLMRGREFLMKDGYSFHGTEEDLDREYDLMFQTYHNIFKRCGLEARAVDADTGSIGGSSSHEFMVLAETGEDQIAVCESCEYAANTEKATYRHKILEKHTAESMADIETPGMKDIESVSKFLKIKPQQMIKTLIYKADDSFVIVCLSGNRSVSDIKLGNAVPANEIRMATDEEVFDLTGVPVGYLGPVGLTEIIQSKNPKAKFKILYDQSILEIEDAATGANKKDYHKVHVSVSRDLSLREDHEHQALVNVAEVVAGDACPKCDSGSIKLIRGIEVGHIFKLGTRYSKPMKVNFLNKDGKDGPMIMGTYGIGVGRTLASSIEQNHDDKGIIWPLGLAPYAVHVITLDQNEQIDKLVQDIENHCSSQNLEILWDDRDDRAGVKFNDADLMGMPLQVVIGKRGLDKGEIEYKVRATGEKGNLRLETLVEGLSEIISQLK